MTSGFHVPDRTQTGVAGPGEISGAGPRSVRIELDGGD